MDSPPVAEVSVPTLDSEEVVEVVIPKLVFGNQPELEIL